MKISYNKQRKRYEAYTYLGKKKVSLGYFFKESEAKKRLEAANKALERGEDLRAWLSSNPNKKAFSSTQEVFENEYNSFLEDEGEPKTVDGYHKKMNFCFSNFRILQKRYEKELEGKTHVAKKVKYFDFSPDLFREKRVHFKYWKAHLAKIGKQMTYCNYDMNEFELKNALLKVFQRNIYIPKFLQPTSDNYCEEWRKIGEELDEIVQESIYGIPKRKPVVKTKIIYNPKMNLDGDERKKISSDHTSAKRKAGTLEKLLQYYEEGMSKKKLSRESGVSPQTIRNHWENLQTQMA